MRRAVPQILFLLGTFLFFPILSRAAGTPPNPGDAVLVIYLNNTYGAGAATFIQQSLNTGPLTAGQYATVTTLSVPSGSSGIAAALSGAGLSLASFCQVWDLRFEPNPSVQTCNTTQDDVITAGDVNLYQSFMGQGGHLVIFGDNAGYCPRDQSILNFTLTATGSSLGFPSTAPSPKTWTGFNNSAPDNFGTNVNNLSGLGGVDTYYPGQLPLAGGIGNGTSMMDDGTNSVAVMWNSNRLTAGNGKLFEFFDTNVVADAPTANDGVRTANSRAFVQNLYTTISTCFNFDITKSVNPGTVCVGNNATFTLCFTNTGARSIPNPKIYDTLPNCVSYVTANYTGTTAGQMVSFNPPVTLTNGQSVCVTMTVQANNTNCQ